MAEVRLSILGHLAELRKRLILCFLVLVTGSSLAYLWVEDIGAFLSRPASTLNFVYLAPPELFLVYLRLSILSGFVLSSPILLSQIWLFLLPALNRKEKVAIFFSLFFGAVLFAIGVTFAFFTILPLSLAFFLTFSSPAIVPMFSFASYISFITSVLLAFGIAFELPVFVLALSKLGIINPHTLGRFRKYALLLILSLSAILTPPDIISQLLLTGPMYLLFEFSLILSKIFRNKKDNL